jgi:hypothetical protein
VCRLHGHEWEWNPDFQHGCGAVFNEQEYDDYRHEYNDGFKHHAAELKSVQLKGNGY